MTLQDTLKNFDDKFNNLKVILVEPDEHSITKDIKYFISQEIKTALESVVPEKFMPYDREPTSREFSYNLKIKGFNSCREKLLIDIENYLKN